MVDSQDVFLAHDAVGQLDCIRYRLDMALSSGLHPGCPSFFQPCWPHDHVSHIVILVFILCSEHFLYMHIYIHLRDISL